MSCKLSWGVDGYGHRHYMCDQCSVYHGEMDNRQADYTQMLMDVGANCADMGQPIIKGKVQNENT